jgi:hypothetical protein
MNIIVSDFGRSARLISISVYDGDEFSTVFRACLDSGVEVFFELDAGFDVWDVVRLAADSFEEEFGLLADGL